MSTNWNDATGHSHDEREIIESCWGIDDETGAVREFNLSSDERHLEAMKVIETKQPAKLLEAANFPYSLKDLKYWVVKRKDGIVTRYNVVKGEEKKPPYSTTPYTRTAATSATTFLHDWCHHTPESGALYSWDQKKNGLWVADAEGMRKKKEAFDFILDCGNIFSAFTFEQDVLKGTDPALIDELLPYAHMRCGPTIIQVDWNDRQAPPLDPEFWERWVDVVKGKVAVACQGGHGRSGTSAVCMMMVLNPEYTPYAAICHLRALHCPRAIESTSQHEYIGKVGEYLKRENDVEKVKEVKSFKDAFLALELKSANEYQEKLSTKEVKIETV